MVKDVQTSVASPGSALTASICGRPIQKRQKKRAFVFPEHSDWRVLVGFVLAKAFSVIY